MKALVSADNLKSGKINQILDYKKINELEQQFGSSFYILNVPKLIENFAKINEAFKSRYKNFIIGYSYKTNYLPYLCKQLSRLGAYAEVVSRLEYDLALKLEENPQRIIFNGPLKSSEDIKIALENGSILNVDSKYEIKHIEDYAVNHPDQQIKIGLRLNFDISQNGISALQDGYEVSRFGICVEDGNLDFVINAIRGIKNVKIVGLHGHFSTKTRALENYRIITEKLCKIAKEHCNDIELEYIDVGGGIYGEIPESFNLKVPTFNEYAEIICKIMNKEFAEYVRKPYLILEPGTALVANAFIFISKVIETKSVRNKQFVLVDGSVHNIKPTMHKRNLPMKIVKHEEGTRPDGNYSIVGYTCMEKDYLAHDIQGETPKTDDYLIFENVGAYTIVFNPPFIKERPGIVAYENGDFFAARKKESIRQFFNEELYIFN